MPKYIDHHGKVPRLLPATWDEFRKDIKRVTKDQFGVVHLNMSPVGDTGEAWCINEAPTEKAVLRMHEGWAFPLTEEDVKEATPEELSKLEALGLKSLT